MMRVTIARICLLGSPLLVIALLSTLKFSNERKFRRNYYDFQKDEKYNSNEYVMETTTISDTTESGLDGLEKNDDQASLSSGPDWTAGNKDSLQHWSTLYQPYHNFSQTVTSGMIDNFQVQLPPLLPNYKNPCWLETIPDDYSCNNTYYASCMRSARFPDSPKPRIIRFCSNVDKLLQQRRNSGTKWRLRCFPYFFLLGVTKSGTTDLYDALFDHVSDAVPGALKEYHFWESKRDPQINLDCDIEPSLKFSTYIDAFELAAEYIRTHAVKYDGEVYHTTVTGDFTPSTLTHHSFWQTRPGNEGRDVPRYTTADYIHRIRPQTKFIIIMRDPVKRLFSNFRMGIRLTKFDAGQSFDREARKAVKTFAKCTRTLSDKSCAYATERNTFNQMLISGLYTIFIEDWLKVFPRGQFLFLQNEYYKKHRLETVQKIVHFLQLAPLSDKHKAFLKEDQENAIQRLSARSSSVPTLSRETKVMLRDFYRPYNKRLARLIENNDFTWGY